MACVNRRVKASHLQNKTGTAIWRQSCQTIFSRQENNLPVSAKHLTRGEGNSYHHYQILKKNNVVKKNVVVFFLVYFSIDKEISSS